MSNIFYVYQLRVCDKELPFYVGKGKNKRAYEHVSSVNSEPVGHKVNTIKRAIREDKEILVEFIETEQTESDAFLFEKYYISVYGRRDLGQGPLTNLTDGGTGGVNMSPETKRKISEANVGTNNPMFGRTGESNPRFGTIHTDEARLKMSEANTGKTISLDTRNKLSAINLGKVASTETKRKMAESKAKNWVIIYPNGDEETIRNLTAFCRDNKLDPGTMIKVAKGKLTKHKGFRCLSLDIP